MRKTIVTVMSGIWSGICMIPLLTSCGMQEDTVRSADIFAMDTYMNLKAYGRDAEAAVAEAEARIYELERAFSVTNDASEIGQITAAVIIMQSFGAIAYLPILLVTGSLAGAFTGLCAQLVLHRIKR